MLYYVGGHLVIINQYLKCSCTDYNIPDRFYVDLTNLKAGDVIRLKHMNIPNNIIITKPIKNKEKFDFVAGVIQMIR